MLDRNMKIFAGPDIHIRQWHVTVMAIDMELFSGSILSNWDSLEKLLRRYHGYRISTVYEAGYFGFWLHDGFAGVGSGLSVPPQNILPLESGNRVMTDRRGSHKLARLLSKEMLRGVWVPSVQERYHHRVARRRLQLLRDRVRIKNRIKAELRFNGIQVSLWTRVLEWNICTVAYWAHSDQPLFTEPDSYGPTVRLALIEEGLRHILQVW